MSGDLEELQCQIHHVIEVYLHGRDYKVCGECWHVWPTEADFRRDCEALAMEMNTSPWRGNDPEWTTPDDLSKVYSCPLCSHDF